jgi:hypothetical protein
MANRQTFTLPPLITLLEEATHLLRRSPASAWMVYYASTLPFALFLFFFLNDMARSANAASHLMESSLLLGLLYGVMKTGQAFYCDQLEGVVEGRAKNGSLPFRGWLRLLSSQILIHSTAPWVLLVSLLAMVPFPWAYAFYHNVTILAVDHFRRGGTTRSLIQIAGRQSHVDWLQNTSAIGVIHVMAFLVYLNVFIGFATGAHLLKSTTGIENPFTMHWQLFFSTTVQGLLIMVCYLGLNPLVKSIYILRCFYGESRTSGADLSVLLRRITAPRVAAPALVLLAMCFPGTGSLCAQSAAPAAPEGRGNQLSQNIERVLQGTEYQWRMPRDGAAKVEESSWLASGFKDLGAWINSILEHIGNAIGDLIDWLFGGKTTSVLPSNAPTGSAWMAMMPQILTVLAVVLVVCVAWIFYRNWQQSRLTRVAEAEVAPAVIDLESEHVVATLLPENEWLRLAREKMEAGELRLALRALFLATLAHLGEKRMLQISGTKSNGDYVREIARKARGHEEVHASFLRQVRTFDRVWYGWHDVTQELMTSFQQEHERITSHAA